ncbi:MAG: hypothetical protein ABIU84_13375 [Thermoanaerobaculia bacterium]
MGDRPASTRFAVAGYVASWTALALGLFAPAAAQLSPAGGELQVNSYTTGAQRSPAIRSDPQGNFVVAWHSNGSSGGDTSSLSIQAQRYDGLFRDDFETADTARWSATLP